jgi:DNA-binding transcriptional MerR regulator/methylmalonyl-CoA mutase cobalamin-binding subunit
MDITVAFPGMGDSQVHMEPRHPIGVVSARTGLPQDLIRAWERRYQAVTPQRTPTGRRLYTDEDVERLKLLKRAVSGGRRISDVAGHSLEELRALIAEDQEEGVDAYTTAKGTRPSDTAPALLEEALSALESLDRRRLERVLAEAAVSLSTPNVRRELIVPLLHSVGDRWREGSIRVVHEHMATAIVRAFLDARATQNAPSAPRIIATTPAGQAHELGALLAAAAADEAGWNAIYLGPNTPAEEIAAGARQLGAKAVALSIAYRDDDHHVQEEVRKLREYLDPTIPIFVGGRSVASLGPSLEADGIHFVPDFDEFKDRLSTLDR